MNLRGKFSRGVRRAKAWSLVILQIGLMLFSGSVGYANPLAPNVVAGSATIHQHGADTLHIHQESSRAIINWQGFSIDPGEVTKFIQPSSSSVILNRVTGANSSALLGSLQSNGQVFLINPNGILVGQGATINVGGLVASTLDIGNAEFMRGGDLTFQGNSTASVVNHGQIQAISGDIYLIGAHVENHGVLQASHGTVGLAAGQEVRLVDSGHQHLVVRVSANSLSDSGVVNTGTIDAVRAELATNGGNVYALAINNTGTLRASGSVTTNGRIMLTAPGGVIDNRGDLIATNADGSGGAVHVLGNDVRLTGGTIDVSGANGGGVVLVGGDYRGANQAIANAQTVYVDNSVSINADATLLGDGGKVIIWSDGATNFAGSISARGGANGGDGGFAEVSGKLHLHYSGLADLQAPLGQTGTLLLDPTDFPIGAGEAATIVANLAGANVVVATAAAGAADGDVDINAPIIYSSANDFAILAHGDIFANASVQNNGSGDVSLVAGWDGVTEMPAGNGIVFPATFNFNNIANNSGSFGDNNGSVFIGDGMQTDGVAVGSRFGETNVAGYNLVIRGSDTDSFAFAQLGFLPGFQDDVDGPIFAFFNNDVTLTGGALEASYAQIGHGGLVFEGSYGDMEGSIVVFALRDIALTGGSNDLAYAQIGHGGVNLFGSQGDFIGVIFTIAGRNLAMTASADDRYTRIGHGGLVNDANQGSIFGDIIVAWDQLDPLADGGGRFFMNHHSEIDAGGAFSPNFIALFGTRRLGNVIENGARIANIPFDSVNFSPATLSSNGWNQNAEFISWAHEQWGPSTSQYTLASPGPFTGPFTFYYLGEDGLTLPAIGCPTYDCFERYEIWAGAFSHMFLPEDYSASYAEREDRPMGELTGDSSGGQ